MRPVRGRRFFPPWRYCATCQAMPGLLVGSTSVYRLRATPDDVALHERGEVECGVLVSVDDQATRFTGERTHRQRQLGFHCLAAGTRFGGGKPAVGDGEHATVALGL